MNTVIGGGNALQAQPASVAGLASAKSDAPSEAGSFLDVLMALGEPAPPAVADALSGPLASETSEADSAAPAPVEISLSQDASSSSLDVELVPAMVDSSAQAALAAPAVQAALTPASVSVPLRSDVAPRSRGDVMGVSGFLASAIHKGGAAITEGSHAGESLDSLGEELVAAFEGAKGRGQSRVDSVSDTFSQALSRAGVVDSGFLPSTASVVKSAESGVGAAPLATLLVDEPFADSRWGAAMNAQVLTMMKNGVTTAHIRINPENLGPVGVDLSMSNGVVNVSFESPYAEVRDALEEGAGGLEQSLSEAGVKLGRLDVKDSLEFMAQDRSQKQSPQDGQGGGRQQSKRSDREAGSTEFSSLITNEEGDASVS